MGTDVSQGGRRDADTGVEPCGGLDKTSGPVLSVCPCASLDEINNSPAGHRYVLKKFIEAFLNGKEGEIDLSDPKTKKFIITLKKGLDDYIQACINPEVTVDQALKENLFAAAALTDYLNQIGTKEVLADAIAGNCISFRKLLENFSKGYEAEKTSQD